MPVETADLAAFTPGRINGLRLRNRIIKTATYEGMSPGGVPNAALVEHHVALARGGVGMNTLAYCAVDASGRTFADQLVMSEAAVEPLRQLTSRVHEAGAAMSIQLAHCGGFSKDLAQGRAARPGPRGPSRALNLYGMSRGLVWIKAMDHLDIAAVLADCQDSHHGRPSCSCLPAPSAPNDPRTGFGTGVQRHRSAGRPPAVR